MKRKEKEKEAAQDIFSEKKRSTDKNCNFEKKDFVQKIKQHRKKGQGIYIHTHGDIYMHTKGLCLKD